MLIEPEEYGPALAPLVGVERLNALRLQAPEESVRAGLEALTTETGVGAGLADPDMGRACLAGLWLYYDFGDKAHEIAQDIRTPTGSFWHGIYHRREPDFWNSKFWFGQVRNHPIFPSLLEVARDAAERMKLEDISDWLHQARTWDPLAFVDLCADALDTGSQQETFCRQVQQSEWELLFDFCYRQAVGA